MEPREAGRRDGEGAQSVEGRPAGKRGVWEGGGEGGERRRTEGSAPSTRDCPASPRKRTGGAR